MTDATHDPARSSWVASANDHTEFPIQNLPFGMFSIDGDSPRGGVAIGDSILDLGAALEAGLFSGEARDAAEAAAGSALNPLLALPQSTRKALRRRLFDILASDSDARGIASRLLHDAAACTLHLPATVGDYTDFFAGIHHARKGGQISRPDNPLMPNYKYVPVAYHSRASSVRPSGEDVRRPNGQRKLPAEAAPTFGPCRNLDYELELGVWIGAPAAGRMKQYRSAGRPTTSPVSAC
jgi:fumarylacetoacetase